MLQIIGAICIVTGCTGMGFYYRQRFHLALWHLRYMKQIIEMFMSEIRYDKATLPECCKRIGAVSKKPYGDALLRVYDVMQNQTGNSFYEHWSEIMDKMLAEIPIEKEERSIFAGLCGNSGMADNNMQLKILEQRRDLLEVSIKSREENLGKQCRMASGLGIMSGLLLAVLLL